MVEPLNFLGLRATDDFISGARPKSWREAVLKLNFAGTAPITALTNLMQSEAVDDPEHSWFEQGPLEYSVEGTAGSFIYEDTGLSDAADNGEAAASTLYIKMAAADAKGFVKGDQVVFIDKSNLASQVYARATADPVINGASSYLTVKTLNADSGNLFATFDLVMKTGTAYAEGADRPTSRSLDSTKRTTYTQIFRNSHKITGTAQEIRTRTMQNKLRNKRMDTLGIHAEDMEMAFWWGYGNEDTSGDEPLREMWGIIPYIEQNKSSNVKDYKVDQSGELWLAKGDEFLDDSLELLSRYKNGTFTAFCGSAALSGLNKLAKANGEITLKPGEGKFGIDVTTWVTSQITLNLVQHPIFSRNAMLRNQVCIITPENLRYRYINNRDTRLIPDHKTKTQDYIFEEYMTECCLEMHHPETFMILKNVGQDG